jgi:hypothetical protein
MKLNIIFPLRFWINLGRRGDRRDGMREKLEGCGLGAERFPAVDARNVGRKKRATGLFSPAHPEVLPTGRKFTMPPANPTENGPGKGLGGNGLPSLNDKFVRGYESAGRYALALTQRLALREARRRGAPAVLLLEDDAVFHPNFVGLAETLDPPVGWGILYLGCSHRARPLPAGGRWVRCQYAVDTHAVAVSAPYYQTVMRMLDRHGKPNPGVPAASDQFLALLHREIPAYACFPNLAWQEVTASDLTGTHYSNYNRDGQQRNWPWTISGLLEDMLEAGAEDDVPNGPKSPDESPTPGLPAEVAVLPGNRRAAKNPRLGLLFLTRGDVNHPVIWREFLAGAPDQCRVFSHVKNPEGLSGGFLEGTVIVPYYETRWGDISLVRASRALLLAALEDPDLTHFVLLSESCVPVKPLPEILRHLRLDPRPWFDYRTLANAHSVHADRISGAPEIPEGCWRFTPQWWLLDRTAAMCAAAVDFSSQFEKMFVPDEAYFATVMALQGYPLEGNVIKRRSTWTWWEKGAGSPTSWRKLPQDKLADLLQSGCPFARKFGPDSDIASLGLHLPAAGA